MLLKLKLQLYYHNGDKWSLHDKTWKTYPEYSDPDACTEGYDVIYGYVAVVTLHYAGADKVAPVGTDSARAKDNMNVASNGFSINF